jgi:hypothetical protein
MTTTKKLLLSVIDDGSTLTDAKRIWRQSSLLESMTLKLAEFVGNHAQNREGEPLIAAAVRHAVSAYTKAEGKDLASDTAFNAYADQIIQHAMLVFSQNIYVSTRSGEVKWMPFECSLTDFVKRHEGTEVAVAFRTPMFPKSVTLGYVMTKLIPSPLLESETSRQIFTDIVS